MLLLFVQVFFARCQSAADMALFFVDIKHLRASFASAGLIRVRRAVTSLCTVLLLTPNLRAVLAHGCFGFDNIFRRLYLPVLRYILSCNILKFVCISYSDNGKYMPASYSLPATKMRTATKEVLIYSFVKYCPLLFEAIRKAAPLLSLKDYCNKFYPFLQISAVPFWQYPFPFPSGQSAMNGGQSGLLSRTSSPACSIRSSVLDIVVTSKRQASASFFCVILPSKSSSFKMRGCPALL